LTLRTRFHDYGSQLSSRLEKCVRGRAFRRRELFQSLPIERPYKPCAQPCPLIFKCFVSPVGVTARTLTRYLQTSQLVMLPTVAERRQRPRTPLRARGRGAGYPMLPDAAALNGGATSAISECSFLSPPPTELLLHNHDSMHHRIGC